MNLYPFQQRGKRDLYTSLRTHNSSILMNPTGSGKTHISMDIIKDGLREGRKINFCVDRLTLLDQTLDKFFEHGIDTGVIQSDHPMRRASAPVQIISLQTLARMNDPQIPRASLWFHDECHDQYQVMYQMMERFGDRAKFVGLSASPFATGLGLHWQDLVVGSTTSELIQEGYLSPYEAYGPDKPDMKGVPTHKGEWQVSGAHERMNVLTGNIVNHWQQHANNRKTLAFTVNVAHAEELAAEFELQGIPADFVCGRDTDERRKRVLKAFAAGELKVLTNCEVLTKGYDQPDVEVGIMAKPTRSLSTHIQMCGRMLRVAPGKQIATYFDHAGNFERHGYPDDPLPTTLSTKERGVSEIDSRGKKEPMPWNCPQCFTVVEHGRNCPSCGYIAKSKSEVDVLPGALKKLDPTQNRKQDVFSMLLGHAELNGFKKGWAAHKFEKIFKVGPDGLSWQPKEPAPALKEWIRGQNYSYMKRERIL